VKAVADADYPAEWPAVAVAVKEAAGWRCKHCGASHGPVPDVLTVHHLDGVKSNLEWFNLVPLCVSCHLRVEAAVTVTDGDAGEQLDLFGEPAFPWLAGRLKARRRFLEEQRTAAG